MMVFVLVFFLMLITEGLWIINKTLVRIANAIEKWSDD